MIAALFVDSETVELLLNIIGFILIFVIPFFFAPLREEK